MTALPRIPEVAILGAGITGLAAAHRLVTADPHVRVTVLEASNRAGGIIRTEHRDGFLIEMGPDSFITNKPGAIQLCRETGFQDQLIPTDERWRRSLVLRNGRPMQVPDGFMLMAPSKPWAVMTSPILSVAGRLRLLAEVMVPRRKSQDDESLSSFVRRRFGSEALDRLVQPLIGGIYTSDPEKLSLRATLPRFPEMEQQHGSVIRATLKQAREAKQAERQRTGSAGARGEETSGSGARYGLFLSARHGLSSMAEAIRDVCQKSGRVTFDFGRRVTAVERQSQDAAPSGAGPSGWRVQVQGESVSRSFDSVIVTLPTWQTAELLKDSRDSELTALLRSIEYASSAVVVSAHSLSDFSHPLDAFGLVIPDQERRSILAVSFSSRKFEGRAPDGKVLLRTFVGGAMQPELLKQPDSDILKTVNDELRSILGMSRPPMFAEIVRYERAMPQYHVGHLDRIANIERALAGSAGLELAGSSYHGVGIPDSIASGREAADRILLQLKQNSDS